MGIYYNLTCVFVLRCSLGWSSGTSTFLSPHVITLDTITPHTVTLHTVTPHTVTPHAVFTLEGCDGEFLVSHCSH